MLAPLLLLLGMALPPPTITLDRIVDRRDHEVARTARLEALDEATRTVVRIIRGPFREDLIFRSRSPRFEKGAAEVHEVWLDGGSPVVLERRGDGARMTLRAGGPGYSFFEEDARTRTVLCHLSRLEGLDPGLLDAAELVEALERALGAALAPPDGPLKLLRPLRPFPPEPAPPGTERRVTLPDDAEGAAALRDAVLAALGK